MPAEDQQPNSEREQTDQSLRVERERADTALSEKLAALEETADVIIEKARERADQVLAAARAKADRQEGWRAPGGRPRDDITTTRVLEDAALRDERANADEMLRAERDARVVFLSTERDETDKDLFIERAGSDGALAMRDEFLGVVSHDLRNMLESIFGFAELITKAESRENHREDVLMYARRILRSSTRMSRLVGDLVDVASIEAGSFAVTREVADPSQLVTEAVDTLQERASAAGISLVAELEAALPAAAFDAARILQVLINLLSNAIKFTPPGGRIVVELRRVERNLRFAVKDTGSGIPPAKLEAVFERFVQVTPQDRRGTGLGLYISKCIVQGHGGRIWANSRLGEGSEFYFTFPIASAV